MGAGEGIKKLVPVNQGTCAISSLVIEVHLLYFSCFYQESD